MIDPLHAAWQRLIKRSRVTPIPIHQHLIIVPHFRLNGTVQCVYSPTSTLGLMEFGFDETGGTVQMRWARLQGPVAPAKRPDTPYDRIIRCTQFW